MLQYLYTQLDFLLSHFCYKDSLSSIPHLYYTDVVESTIDPSDTKWLLTKPRL